MISRLTAAIVGFAIVLAPFIAEACPACAGRDRGGTMRLVLLGAMILTPFVIARVVAKAIRNEERRLEGTK